MFRRVVRAEVLKLRRTFAFRMAVLAPATVVTLLLFLCAQAPFSTLRKMGANDWLALERLVLLLWCLLMLPLYLTLQSSLTTGVDHADNQWKSILTRPVPRWSVYTAKFLVLAGLLVLGTLLLVMGTIGAGLLLPHLQSEAPFLWPIPVGRLFRDGLLTAALAFPALAIQYWINLRTPSFATGCGIGALMMVVGYGMYAAAQPYGGWTQYFPWSLPALVTARATAVDMGMTLAASAAAGCVIVAAGCVEFCRREVG